MSEGDLELKKSPTVAPVVDPAENKAPIVDILKKARGVVAEMVKLLDPGAPDFFSEDVKPPSNYASSQYEFIAIYDRPDGSSLGVVITRTWGGINDGVFNCAVADYTSDEVSSPIRTWSKDRQVLSVTYLFPSQTSRVFHLVKGQESIMHGGDTPVADDAGLLDKVTGVLQKEKFQVLKKGLEYKEPFRTRDTLQ